MKHLNRPTAGASRPWMSTSPWRATLVLGLVLASPLPVLADGGGSVTCPNGTAQPLRDCDAEASDLDQRLNPLLEQATHLPGQDGLRAAVVDALRSLRLARVQLCRDWNVCAVEANMHSARLASIDRELSGAARLLDLFARRRRDGQAGLGTWASGLESRISVGATNTPGTPTIIPPSPQVTPQILEVVANLEAQIADIEAARPMVARVRDELALPADGSPPRACGSQSTLRDDLSAAIRAGGNQSSSLSSLRRQLDDICERFARWQSPDDGLVARELSFIEYLGRVEGWMHDIQDCVHSQGWNRRCENNYGAQPDRAVEQVQRALRLLAQVRTALENVPNTRPFPCRAPIWAQLKDSQFDGHIVQINVPRIGTDAARLCQSIGVDEEGMSRRVQQLDDEVARTLAQLTQQATTYRSSLHQLRANFHLDP